METKTALQAFESIKADITDFRDVIEGASYTSDDDLELVEQDLVTLQFIRSIWLSDKISEKKTVEYITEMLFSNKKWIKEVVE